MPKELGKIPLHPSGREIVDEASTSFGVIKESDFDKNIVAPLRRAREIFYIYLVRDIPFPNAQEQSSSSRWPGKGLAHTPE